MSRQQTLRQGFTIVELLVVIAIIAVLVGLLMPAVKAPKDPSRRLICANTLRQLLLAVQNYEDAYGCFPPAGHGIDEANLALMRESGAPPVEVFDNVSVFTRLLPMMDGKEFVRNYEWSRAYNDPAVARCDLPEANSETWNSYAAKQRNFNFYCPANWYIHHSDPAGYGTTDFMPVSYTDIDPKPDARGIIGLRNRRTTAIGAFSMRGSRHSEFFNGLSKTIAIVESAGRLPESEPPAMCGAFDDPICLNSNGSNDSCTKTSRRAFWRWAEPASAGGISGPRNHGANGVVVPFIQMHSRSDFGGSKEDLATASCLSPPPEGTDARCLWTWTNCGPNDEIHSFHHRGANTAYADGSVHFLEMNIDPVVLRHLLSRDERIPVAIELPE